MGWYNGYEQVGNAAGTIEFPQGAPSGSEQSSESSSSGSSYNYAGYDPSLRSGATSWLSGQFPGFLDKNNPAYKGMGYLDNIYQNFYGNNGQNAYANIEKQREALIDQYMKSMENVQQTYQPVMNNMSSRGILNSSVTGDALSDIQKRNNELAAQNIAGANVYAAQQQAAIPDKMSNLATIYQGLLSSNQQNLLQKVMDISKYAEGSSHNQSSSNSQGSSWDWSSLLPYL
jgi:hypothetical protein